MRVDMGCRYLYKHTPSTATDDPGILDTEAVRVDVPVDMEIVICTGLYADMPRHMCVEVCVDICVDMFVPIITVDKESFPTCSFDVR